MRAVVAHTLNGTAGLRLEEAAAPTMPSDGVRIAVHAAAVNFVDWLVVQGLYQSIPKLPFIPGKEAAGIVAECGPAAHRFRVGDRVLMLVDHGAYADETAAPEASCFAVPDGIALDEAVAICIPYQTAYFALDRAAARAGESVLVLGATSATGTAAVELAKVRGLKVLAGVTTKAKAYLALARGADAVIDLSHEGLRESIRDEVRAATGGKGADIALDMLGGESFDGALRALAPGGRMVVIGFAAGEIPSVKVNYLLLRNLAVLGFNWGQVRSHALERTVAAQDEIFALRQKGRIAPVIQARLPLEKCAEAFGLIRDRKVEGRIVLAVR
jgi:NADPH2:quinone reductase